MNEVEFWFEFASTYSHIAAQTVEARADAAGVRLIWKPFLLGPIFRTQGWNDSPFNILPVKGAYMWRDMERECERLDVPYRRPSVFPRNGLLAARVAAHSDGTEWQAAFVRGVYLASFRDDQDISDASVLSGILEDVGATDPEMVLDAARSEAAKSALRSNTEEAVAHGIFGAPSFRVGGELFWGADRMDQVFGWPG